MMRRLGLKHFKLFNTINVYIFKSLFYPFIISLFFLNFVFLMTRIPEMTNMIVNHNASFFVMLYLIIYSLPIFLEYTIPMSIMISVLLTFMRMSADNEIIALKGAGINLYQIFSPVLLFCLMGVFTTLWITLFGVSWGKVSIKKKSMELAKSSVDFVFKERQFNCSLDKITIYISQVDVKTKDLKDIYIEDRRKKGLVSISTAPSGKFILDKREGSYSIMLFNGAINQVNIQDGTTSNIEFNNYKINISLDQFGGNPGTIHKKNNEKTFFELLALIRSKPDNEKVFISALMVFHEKFAIPFACLVLGVLAFPVGVQSDSVRRSSGLGLGISFFLLYYLLLAAGMSAGNTGYVPPMIALWIPNIVMSGVAGFFLIKTAKEQPVQFHFNLKKITSKSKIWKKRGDNDSVFKGLRKN